MERSGKFSIGVSLRSLGRSPKRFKIVRANEGRTCWSKTRGTTKGRRGRGPYRTNRRAVKSIARYFAPPRAASFRREILLTSFRVLRTSPSSLPFSNHSLLSEIHFRRCVEIIRGERLVKKVLRLIMR